MPRFDNSPAITDNGPMADHSEPTGTPLTVDVVNDTVRSHWADSPHVCIDIGPTFAVARHEIDQSRLRPGGFVPGPTMFSMADLVLWYLCFGALNRVEPMALTSELSIRFLRPAQGQTLFARADLDKAGRTSVVGTVKLWMDDQPERLVATAQGTYALPREA